MQNRLTRTVLAAALAVGAGAGSYGPEHDAAVGTTGRDVTKPLGEPAKRRDAPHR